MRTTTTLATLLALALFAGVSANASTIYEPFNYTTGANLNGQNGGTGFGAAWVSTVEQAPGTEFQALSPGLTFSTLPVAGNRAQRSNQGYHAVAYRTLSAGSITALTADNSTIWFSALVDDTAFTLDFALSFGDEVHVYDAGDPDLASAGNGFGFWLENDTDIYAMAYNSSTDPTKSSGSLNTADNGTRLIVGKINWKTIGTNDQLFLFNVTDLTAAEPAEGTAFASITGDFDQSQFDVISMWDRGATAVDEIRFATSYQEILGVPEPASLALLGVGLLGLAVYGWRRRK